MQWQAGKASGVYQICPRRCKNSSGDGISDLREIFRRGAADRESSG
ncbi:MAG TPA: hypothetical protein VLA19_05090 [Herpetosiphonaceae bacterium]|nr:hypothetical protein [Herpetosiphonaceae bacterium]